MSTESIRFPYRQINSDEIDSLVTMWGGNPADKDSVSSFMTLGGKPLLSNDFRMGLYISRVGRRMTDHLEARSGKAGFMFMTGALMYAGVYQHLTSASRMPVQDTAIAQLTRMNDADYVVKADQDFRLATGKLHELIRDRVLPIMSHEEKLLDIGMLGAGAVHALIIESELSLVEPSYMDAQFPDLIGLFDNFPPAEK